jgi:RHS repeat-associated protein
MRLVLVLLVALTSVGEEVPQAVKALEHLRPKADVGPFSWVAGPYLYDGAGNVAAIGNETYFYDKVSRLTSANMRGPDLVNYQTQTFGYDEYGNLTGTARLGQTVPLPVLPGTNFLQGVTYDAAGNLTDTASLHYDYDAVGMPNAVRLSGTAQPRIIYAYTAGDERLFSFDVTTSTTHWTLRGLDNQVLRDFRQVGPQWSVDRDYVYRDGLLLAALKPGGAVEHYTLDPLGTPRLITDGGGHKVGYHVYWPFGEEWSDGSAQEGSPLKFLGQERDADQDYLHARFYRPTWGRFLKVDPLLDLERAPGQPQSWNRYSYALNNPLRFVDPNGDVVSLAGLDAKQRAAILQSLNEFTGNTYDVDENDNLIVTAYGKNASATASQFLAGAIESRDVYAVQGVNGDRDVTFGRADPNAKTVTLDFKDFTAMRYGDFNPRTFSLGSNLIHELIHVHNGIIDPKEEDQSKITGPVVDYVNRMRAERGFELRGPMYGGGGVGNTVEIPFIARRSAFLRYLIGDQGVIRATNF